MGANVAQQFIKAGLLDEIQIHLVPVLLGAEQIELGNTRVIEAPGVAYLTFRVVKED